MKYQKILLLCVCCVLGFGIVFGADNKEQNRLDAHKKLRKVINVIEENSLELHALHLINREDSQSLLAFKIVVRTNLYLNTGWVQYVAVLDGLFQLICLLLGIGEDRNGRHLVVIRFDNLQHAM